MPIVDESKQNKGVNNNTRNKQMAIDMEYYNRLNHLRFKSPYLGAKYQQRVIPVRTLNGVQDVFVDNRGTIKQGGHTHSKLYNYSNRNRTHPIKGAYAREVDSWNNNTSPIKALVNSGIGYALAPAAQAVYDYTKGALNISKNPTKASNYLVMLPVMGYAVKAPLKRGVEVAMRTSNNANPIEDIVYNMHKASPKKHAGVLSYISTGVGYNTYAPEAYTGFQKAAKGNVLFMESNSNGSRKSPILNAIVNGKSVNNRLNFLANNNRTDEYGSIAGGRIIIQAGKEIRLVSGSIDNIRDEIEAMKSRNNVKTVDLYTLDNGTYHSGLRTFDKIFTRDDLLEYDAQNTGGGNFLYIK